MPRPKAEAPKPDAQETVIVRYLKGDSITVHITSAPLTIEATGTEVPKALSGVLLAEPEKFGEVK